MKYFLVTLIHLRQLYKKRYTSVGGFCPPTDVTIYNVTFSVIAYQELMTLAHHQ